MKNIIKKIQKESPKVYIIENIEELDDIVFSLAKGKDVIVNIKNIPKVKGIQIIYFLLGYTYALGIHHKKIDEGVFKFFH